jgi:CheY-like chemotaxis protein
VSEPGPILLVDDDATSRSLVTEALGDEGYQVVTAADGAAALEIVASRRPCVILLDMRMPGMDGWAFAGAYRRRPGPHAPIVVCSAAADARQRAAEIEAAGHLAKPFGLDALLAVAQRYARPNG